MTAEAVEPRPNRRALDGGPLDSARLRRRRLVRHIAADPELVGWLGGSKARTLHSAAARLSEAGHKEAAELVRHMADDLASGHMSPF